MIFTPIATVSSCFGGKFGVPRQPGLCPSSWGELTFFPKFRSAEAVRGLVGFSHIWLIFGFHQTAAAGWHPTVRPPRLGGNTRMGVFATRSPYRPNPLGLSLVRLEEIDFDSASGPVLKLGGIDLVNGTPVYDIKPYLAYAEAVPGAAGGYAADVLLQLEVKVSPAASGMFSALPERSQRVILEALACDPRPATQLADEARVFGVNLCGVEVKFSVSSGVCEVLEIP